MGIRFYYDPEIGEMVFEMKDRGLKRILTKTKCRSLIKMLESSLSLGEAYDILEREIKIKEAYDRRVHK